MKLLKDFLKKMESEFLNFNRNYKKGKWSNHFKGSRNLGEYVSEKIKFISLTDFFVEPRKDGRTKTLI